MNQTACEPRASPCRKSRQSANTLPRAYGPSAIAADREYQARHDQHADADARRASEFDAASSVAARVRARALVVLRQSRRSLRARGCRSTLRHNSRQHEENQSGRRRRGLSGALPRPEICALEDCELVGVVDADPETARPRGERARHRGTAGLSASCSGKVDAVSVVTPTPTHCEIAHRICCSTARTCWSRSRSPRPSRRRERLIDTARANAARAAGRAPGALQSGHPGSRAAADARRASSSATGWRRSGARHRRQRGARSDDPRYRSGADDRRQPGCLARCDRYAGVFRRDRHRQCAPAIRERLRRQCHCQPRQSQDRAQAARVSATTPTCRSICSRRSSR